MRQMLEVKLKRSVTNSVVSVTGLGLLRTSPELENRSTVSYPSVSLGSIVSLQITDG
jgi:hypothetical protein